MKKHDEGYALVLVVVVMAVLMLVALSVLSLSLRNLQSQQASIERMQAKYAAQGKVEIIQAELERLVNPTEVAVRQILQDNATEYNFDWESLTGEISVYAQNASVDAKVSCTIDCKIQLTKVTVGTNTVFEVTYTSYTISTEKIGGEP